MCSTNHQVLVWLRAFALVCIGLGIVLVYQGVQVNRTVTNVQVGVWWAGAVMVIAAIIGFLSSNRTITIAGSIALSIAVAVTIVAAVITAISYVIINGISTCFDEADHHIYGDLTYSGSAISCANGHSEQCSCVSNGNNECYYFSLRKDSADCNVILTTYTSLLRASLIVAIISVLSILIAAVLSIVLSWCAEHTGDFVIDNTNNTGMGHTGDTHQTHHLPAQQQSFVDETINPTCPAAILVIGAAQASAPLEEDVYMHPSLHQHNQTQSVHHCGYSEGVKGQF